MKILYNQMNFLNKFKYARDSYVLTVFIIGIVLMTGYISMQHFARIDLTESQSYAVSDASKDIMQELDDIVTIKVYFSEELPPNLFKVRQYVEDILGELGSYANGNLSIRFLNPADDAIAKEAQILGIPPIRMNILAKDKFEVKNGFLGMAGYFPTQPSMVYFELDYAYEHPNWKLVGTSVEVK